MIEEFAQHAGHIAEHRSDGRRSVHDAAANLLRGDCATIAANRREQLAGRRIAWQRWAENARAILITRGRVGARDIVWHRQRFERRSEARIVGSESGELRHIVAVCGENFSGRDRRPLDCVLIRVFLPTL